MGHFRLVAEGGDSRLRRSRGQLPPNPRRCGLVLEGGFAMDHLRLVTEGEDSRLRRSRGAGCPRAPVAGVSSLRAGP